jgi:AcrR family transcriptional regulator
VTAPPSIATERSERTRRRILEAAGRCFADLGFAKTTVEEIARAAGVSKALVYLHFHGKEELLEAVFQGTLDEWSAFTRSEAERQDDGSVAGAIAAMHRASIEYARDHPLLRSLINREAAIALAPHLRPVGRRVQEEWREQLAALIARGIENGELRPDLDPYRIADVIRLLNVSFIDRLFDPEPINVTDADLIDTSVKILQGGIQR